MKVSKENTEHYYWGNKCRGWHFVKSKSLSIIEERMPPNTSEEKHYHEFSEQFFYILKGKATFEIEQDIIEVSKGEGVYIKPQIIHQINNLQSSELEFIVISQPRTRGDKIDEPFIESGQVNLNGKQFKSVSSSKNGEVSSETIFEYHQDRNIVWATYKGGGILFGTLSGTIATNRLIFTYQHQNLEGEFKTGKCESIVEGINGKVYLKEKWEWTCDDFSKGESILEQVTNSGNL